MEGTGLIEGVREDIKVACFVSSRSSHDLRHNVGWGLGERIRVGKIIVEGRLRWDLMLLLAPQDLLLVVSAVGCSLGLILVGQCHHRVPNG